MDNYYLYLIVVLGLFILSLAVQSSVSKRYKQYSKVRTASGITGAQAAKQMLLANGVDIDIILNPSGKDLSDYYDPRSNTIHLSPSAYNNSSVAAVGVACHEAGHALQYARAYAPARVRMSIIPITKVTSYLAFPLIIIGLLLSYMSTFFWYLAVIGVILFALTVLVQVITLPVEFDASRRAMQNIESCGILQSSEMEGVKKILTMAAMTYVVSMLSSLVQLMRFIGLVRRR